MLTMLTTSCFKQLTESQVCLKVFSCNFLVYSGETHVVVTRFTHINSGLWQIFKFFIKSLYLENPQSA